MLDVIICANFGVEKLRGLGNTRGQILEFPIEMAGHLYNRAGATAQPVINKQIKQVSKQNYRVNNSDQKRNECGSENCFSLVSCNLAFVVKFTFFSNGTDIKKQMYF